MLEFYLSRLSYTAYVHISITSYASLHKTFLNGKNQIITLQNPLEIIHRWERQKAKETE